MSTKDNIVFKSYPNFVKYGPLNNIIKRGKMQKYKLLFLFIPIALILSISACKTFEGLGKDMQKAGEWVEEKAK